MNRKVFHWSLGFVLLLGIACSNAAGPAPTDTPAHAPAATGTAAPSVEQAYTVKIDPANFVDKVDNRYFPLLPGTRWVYEGRTEDGLEHIEVEVLPETREVLGVTTTVVRDTVTLDGEMVEDTFDWYAQDADGNVWYFGEEVSNFKDGALADHDGSWEAGVDGALPGIIMYADPAVRVGETYRQEYYAGEAEDMAEILSLGEAVSTASGAYRDCLRTKEWTPLDPGVVEEKSYAPGIGMVLEVVVAGGDGRTELVNFETE